MTLNVLTWRWSALARDLEAQPEVGLGTYPTWVFAWMGRPADTSRIAEKLFERNPNLGTVWIILAVSQAYAGDRAGSIATLRRAPDLQAVNPLLRIWVGYNQITTSNGREGLTELQFVERQLGANCPTVYLPELAYAYARHGRSADAQRIFDEFRTSSGTRR